MNKPQKEFREIILLPMWDDVRGEAVYRMWKNIPGAYYRPAEMGYRPHWRFVSAWIDGVERRGIS